MNPAQLQLFEKAISLHQQQRYQEAQELYNRVLNGLPFDPNVTFCMADMYLRMDYNGLAINLLSNHLQQNPENAEAWCNLGVAYRKENKDEHAKKAWERALDLAGDSPEVCNNMAGLYADRSEPDKALPWIDRALKLAPDDPSALWHKSLALLTLGRYAEGWALYGNRTKKDGWYPRHAVHCPQWDGKPVGHLYIHGEQGVGDEIMFASAIPHVIPLAKRITLEVNPKVVGICKQTWPDFHVVSDETPGEYDAKVPIGSLLGMFGTHPKPYLKPNPELVAQYREQLERLGPGPYVALTWLGGTKVTRAATRSLALSDLDPVMNRYTCVSAQYSHKEIWEHIERERHKNGLAKLDEASAGEDLHAQAALFCAVDAVVTVQQTAVHVAGAVGAKTFAVIGTHPHWRYGLTGDMPWYDSVKLYRRDGEWSEAIDRVMKDLDAYFG